MDDEAQKALVARYPFEVRVRDNRYIVYQPDLMLIVEADSLAVASEQLLAQAAQNDELLKRVGLMPQSLNKQRKGCWNLLDWRQECSFLLRSLVIVGVLGAAVVAVFPKPMMSSQWAIGRLHAFAEHIRNASPETKASVRRDLKTIAEEISTTLSVVTSDPGKPQSGGDSTSKASDR